MSHTHAPLQGGTRCQRAQQWTKEFCEEIINSYVQDIEDELTQVAFPAEAALEEETCSSARMMWKMDNLEEFNMTAARPRRWSRTPRTLRSWKVRPSRKRGPNGASAACGCSKVAHYDGALKHFHCPACDSNKTPQPSPSTRLPSNYKFNEEVAVDCFEVRDANSCRYTVMSMVDMGTLYHGAAIVNPTGRLPRSR